MSDVSGGPGWWQASDGKWYAPELHPDAAHRQTAEFDTATDNVFATPSATDDVFTSSTQLAREDVPATPSSAGTDNVFAAPATMAGQQPDTQFEAPTPSTSGANAYDSVQYPAFATGKPKSKVLAGILGIVLGTLGAHRFYLGYKKLGSIMLALSVLSFGRLGAIIFLWGAVEGVLILTGVIKQDAYGAALT